MRLHSNQTAFIPTKMNLFSIQKVLLQAASVFGTDIPTQKTLETLPLYQGNTNGCGTTSLAMALNILNAYRPNTQKRSVPFTREQLDQGVREWDSYASVSILQEAARNNGFYGEVYPNLSFETLVKHLSNNEPIVALINPVSAPFKDDSALHYVLIDGYNQENPNRPRIRFTDPALQSNAFQWIDFEVFKTNFWQTKTWRGLPIGATQVGLVLSNTKNSLPVGPPLNLQFQVAAVANSVINQTAKWFKNWLQ